MVIIVSGLSIAFQSEKQEVYQVHSLGMAGEKSFVLSFAHPTL